MASKPLKGMTAERAQRAAQVVELYDTGTSFDKIAKQLGISRTQAREDYRAAIDAIYAETVHEKVGKVERNYLRLMNAYWGPAIGVGPGLDDEAKPNPKAADIVLDVLKGYRELFGLDKAIKMEVSSTAAADFATLLGAIRGEDTDQGTDHGMSQHPGPDLSDDAAGVPEEE